MSDWLDATFAEQRPRAIAALTRVFRDIDLAEEAFAEACVKALIVWGTDGAPRDPLAWLLTTARNAGLDHLRKSQRRAAILSRHSEEFQPLPAETPDPDELRDDVLRLLFICCHPELDRQDQIAVALRVILGLSVAEIASGFLVKPKTMEQRITRAKRKIAENPVAFETPTPQERGVRLSEVSLMIYLMFNEGWSTSSGPVQMKLTLCEEAIRLARLLVRLFPAMGEQSALLALLLLQHARRHARIDGDGKLVTLDDQDRSLWDRSNIAEAMALLQKAQRINHRGIYIIQATIAAAHASAATSEKTDWALIESHYAALYALQPTPVVRLNQIAAQAKLHGPRFAINALETLTEDLSTYRWFHAMRGGLLQEIGDHRAAIAAFETVLTLTPTAPERAAVTDKIAISQNELGHL
ncbi:RNA polymerase sigma factor [Cognatiyoonia sp. IB215182]|uniref:RNA polymerase sigma factor n=1 Tax=Cognatiyoonia sp. IB215182 TaxID=3097353 RepID=UPI002A0D68BC|nr:sigma-70 family RNA polymerase sigma factor [Cognatiyoonia sp. IB215182]MDX8351812.1 sigma-70 family RNA polymerase sigma factor [Cognatiyoonia sp. IB215182]